MILHTLLLDCGAQVRAAPAEPADSAPQSNGGHRRRHPGDGGLCRTCARRQGWSANARGALAGSATCPDRSIASVDPDQSWCAAERLPQLPDRLSSGRTVGRDRRRAQQRGPGRRGSWTPSWWSEVVRR